MVKVSSSMSGKYLGVADTKWQLKEILNNAEAHTNVFHMEESEFELPTMLITTNVMKSVHDAVSEHRQKGIPISKCIRLKKMDQHMLGTMQKVSVH